jgi:V/A-type H+-transporting ATPase subunit K
MAAEDAGHDEKTAAAGKESKGQWGIFGIAIAAGLAIAITGYATAIVQKDVGSAAVGAMAENEKLFVKGLVLTALPETIVLFGFVIAIILTGYLKS